MPARIAITTPPLVETVHSCTSVLRIHGKRSSKGWRLLQLTTPNAEPLVIDPRIIGKDHAIRTALDCCGEAVNSTFILKPATEAGPA
jgi:hypothetical protein